MFDVLDMIYLRLTKLFEKKGYVVDGGDASWPEGEDSSVPSKLRFGSRNIAGSRNMFGSELKSRVNLAAILVTETQTKEFTTNMICMSRGNLCGS